MGLLVRPAGRTSLGLVYQYKLWQSQYRHFGVLCKARALSGLIRNLRFYETWEWLFIALALLGLNETWEWLLLQALYQGLTRPNINQDPRMSLYIELTSMTNISTNNGISWSILANISNCNMFTHLGQKYCVLSLVLMEDCFWWKTAFWWSGLTQGCCATSWSHSRWPWAKQVVPILSTVWECCLSIGETS